MRIYLDSINPEEIKWAVENRLVYGVTMNPFLLKGVDTKKRSFIELIMELEPLVENEFHIQVPGINADELVKNALRVFSINEKKIVIKIPATEEGILAASILKRKGVRVTLTAVTTVNQALVANQIGVDYIAPFVTRVYELGGDGISLIKQIASIYKLNNSTTKIIAASIRSREQIVRAFLAGADAVTVKFDLLRKVLKSKKTSEIVEEMNKIWSNIIF
ncbi:transaldolase family protein [Infirmifilum sp.]|uniref:transaldolase family protein n=1 Tax=Infirmifilum sp. TaxID=2856575 RepID=UPI003D13145B